MQLRSGLHLAEMSSLQSSSERQSKSVLFTAQYLMAVNILLNYIVHKWLWIGATDPTAISVQGDNAAQAIVTAFKTFTLFKQSKAPRIDKRADDKFVRQYL